MRFISYRARRRALLAATAICCAQVAFAADVNVPNGTTLTSKQSLSGTDTLTVDAGGAITTNKNPSVELKGNNSNLTIDNSGTISSTDGRAIRTKSTTGSFSLILTNRSGALIEGTDDGIGIDGPISGGTVTLTNNGTIRSTTDGQAIDFDKATGGTISIRNNGVIEADGTKDVVRPGENATITNLGVIRSANDGSWNGTDWDRGDGIDFQANGSGKVINFGVIEAAKHGITGDTGATAFEITNAPGGLILGRNGSGINFDIPDNATPEQIAALSTAKVVNYGVIAGAALDESDPAHANADGDGVDIDYLANIENHGFILALGAVGDKNGNPEDPNIADAISIGGGAVTNAAGALIYSVGRGILVDDSEGGSAYGATTIENAGWIASQSGQAITIRGSYADLVNNSGVIIGSVDLGAGDDNLINSGSIVGDVAMGDGTDTVKNSGLIAGTVDLSSGYKVLDNTGTIDGSVLSTASSGSYTNAGLIRGDVMGGSYLDNSGMVGGNVSVGQWVGGVDNSGTIAGDVFAGGSLISNLGNSGTIGGDVIVGSGVGYAYNAGSIGGGMRFTGRSRVLDNSGRVGGDVVFAGGDDVLNNTGAIGGNVGMGSGDDTVNNAGTIGGGVYFADNYHSSLNNSGSIGGNVWIGYARQAEDKIVFPDTIPPDAVIVELPPGLEELLNSLPKTSNVVINSGSIGGDVTFTGFSSDELIESGTIAGNVWMGRGSDFVELRNGPSIAGTLDGGEGVDSLSIWSSQPGVSTLKGVTNFETLAIQSGNWTFGDDEAYSNGVTVYSGAALAVNTALSAVTTVQGGATLSGGGSVAGLVGIMGAVIVPGTGTSGQLTVNGDASLSDATLQIGMAANGASNQLVVTGSAAINGGTVALDLAPGPYVVGTKATIVTAAGGISGSGFSTLQAPSFLFLDPKLRMDANTVSVSIDRNGVPFASFARTQNEWAVANALDAGSANSVLYNTVANISNPVGLAEGYNSLSGEIHADIAGALLDQASQTELTLLNRLRQIGMPGKTQPASDHKTAYGDETTPDTSAFDALENSRPRYSAWMQGFGSWLNRDGNGNAASTSSSVGGALAGADFSNDNYTFGLAGGYSWGSADTSGTQGSADIDTALLAIYGGVAFDAVKLRGGASMGWSTVDTTRVAAIGNIFERPQASYNATTGNVFGEVAYDAALGGSVIEPYAGLGWVNVSSDDFTEINAPLTGLSSSGLSYDTGYSTLGVRFSTDFVANGTKITPRGMLGWRHAFSDVSPEAAMLFNNTGTGFTVAGTPIAQDSLLVEAGADFAFNQQLSLGVTYAGSFADSADSNSIKVTGELRF